MNRPAASSVCLILCTHNPRLDLLRWVFSSLREQSISQSEWELVLVDNGSVSTPEISAIAAESDLSNFRVVHEPQVGLTAARCAGIRASAAPLLIFVDDDNFLQPDYIANALLIASNEPELGAYGGIAEAKFEVIPPLWLSPILPNLGIRNYGPTPITSFSREWGPWEPIGAGMVCRRSVAERFVELMNSSSRLQTLGRTGKSLLSGEDSVLARCANQLGLANGYRPSLRLVHFIKDRRLSVSYLAELMMGHGISFTRRQLVLGCGQTGLEPSASAQQLVDQFRSRIRQLGDAGYLQWFWDLGSQLEATPRTWPPIYIAVSNDGTSEALFRCLSSLQAQIYPDLNVLLSANTQTGSIEPALGDFKSLRITTISLPTCSSGTSCGHPLPSHLPGITAWIGTEIELKPGALFVTALLFSLNATATQLTADHQTMMDGCIAPISPHRSDLAQTRGVERMQEFACFYRPLDHEAERSTEGVPTELDGYSLVEAHSVYTSDVLTVRYI